MLEGVHANFLQKSFKEFGLAWLDDNGVTVTDLP
jgi:hypothetical protein